MSQLLQQFQQANNSSTMAMAMGQHHLQQLQTANQLQHQFQQPIPQNLSQSHNQQQSSPQPQPLTQLQSEWEIIDHNEIYLIKPESLRKSYDCIVRKLQKERIKFMKKCTNNQLQQQQQDEEDGMLNRESEEQLQREFKQFRDEFSGVKELFTRKFRTRQLLIHKQQQLRKKWEQAQEELKQEQQRNDLRNDQRNELYASRLMFRKS